MIDKVGHIKNPLTVIAMFAAIAEVSGTVVLPLLQVETQKIFVWFLIIFPCMLVAAFFVTLLWKHHVLYAPSDYKNDDNFIKMFRPGLGPFRDDRLLEGTSSPSMVASDSGNPGAEQESSSDSSTPDSSTRESSGERLDANLAASADQPTSNVGAVLAKKANSDTVLKALYAEELAVTKLSIQYNVNFVRNVVPNGAPSIEFDAVGSNDVSDFYVEIKYCSRKILRNSILDGTYRRFQYYQSTLSNSSRLRSIFIFVIVVDEQAEIYKNSIQEAVEDKLKNWDMKVISYVYTLDELKRDLTRISPNGITKFLKRSFY